ncbi:MAG: SpoIIE family protein phosphatase [Bacteroidia bacterium]|nr:SpoIIE family protein phosphatase [Bacteroidia bacterium]
MCNNSGGLTILVKAWFYFLCSVVLLLAISESYSQTVKFPVANYTSNDYGRWHESSNLAIIQDSYGILYFGNAGGILQYDGIRWNFISINKNAWVYSLAIDSSNNIYVGSQGEFGYIRSALRGKLIYKSLTAGLGSEDSMFFNIRKIYVLGSKIIFQAEEKIFIYEHDSMTVISPDKSFHTSFVAAGKFFVRERGKGLLVFNNNKLEKLTGSEIFSNTAVFGITAAGNSATRFIIATNDAGLYIYDSASGLFETYLTEHDSLLKSSIIYDAIQLTDNNIAYCTRTNGLIITDGFGSVISVVNRKTGLNGNSPLCALQDYQDNIWLGLENGIAMIEYSSLLSFYSSADGLNGRVNTIEIYNHRLFAGTSDGLFYANLHKKNYCLLFSHISYFPLEVLSLCAAGKNLFIGAEDGLFRFNDKQYSKILDIQISALYYSLPLNMLFAGSPSGLYYIDIGKNLNIPLKITGIEQDIKSIKENPSPAGPFSEIWCGTALQGAIRIRVNKTGFEVEKYDNFDGLKAGEWVTPFFMGKTIVFGQRSGLLAFMPEEELKKIVDDSLKDKEEFTRGYFYPVDIGKNRIDKPVYIVAESKKKTYIYYDGDICYFMNHGDSALIHEPFVNVHTGKVNCIFTGPDEISWMGSDEGIIRYDADRYKNYMTGFCVNISRIYCNGDSILFEGGNTSALPDTFKIKYTYNSLIFEFSAPFYEGKEKLAYCYKLDQNDIAFSQWQPENRILLTNIPEGKYTLIIKAKNCYGIESKLQSFMFTILTPWYRTVWAYITYVIAAVFIVYLIVWLNIRRLRALNKRLEKIIRDRTREIQEKNRELETQKNLVEYQKQEILDSINYALRIQKAALPSEEFSKIMLGEHFILFRPKDIVSGDFYWMTIIKQYLIACAADCTGHGVPGAFMSMLGIAFLNEVVRKEEVTSSNSILESLRNMVIESLQQKGLLGGHTSAGTTQLSQNTLNVKDMPSLASAVKDGMDIALFVVNLETYNLEFSGANNPLYLIRKNSLPEIECNSKLEYNNLVLYEIKGDGMPIGIYEKMEKFRCHSIDLLEDDRLYVFSDGFADQFGGPKGKKFKYKSFKQLLLETGALSMNEQKQAIGKALADWMAYINPVTKRHFEQIDDICVIGLKM